VVDGMSDQHGLGLLDIGVRRNGYGRQVVALRPRWTSKI